MATLKRVAIFHLIPWLLKNSRINRPTASSAFYPESGRCLAEKGKNLHHLLISDAQNKKLLKNPLEPTSSFPEGKKGLFRANRVKKRGCSKRNSLF